jgi:hypothetical protein
MSKCVCCDGKIRRGEAVAHESCIEREPDDDKVLALLELQANWRRVRDETAIARAAVAIAPYAVDQGEALADLLYPGGRS